MPDFVDYTKRSVDLPPGCKDLADVLKGGKRTELPRRLNQTSGEKPPSGEKLPFNDTATSFTHYLSKYLETIEASRAFMSHLWITALDGEIMARIFKGPKSGLQVEFQVRENSDHDQAIRAFLENQKLPAPPPSPMPASFHPDLPVYLSHKISPLPAAPHDLLKLVRAGLIAAGVTDLRTIKFEYRESDWPPGLKPKEEA
jgi:hypothetical protein